MEAEDRERLVRIETKLDAFVDTMKDHETRIRSGEKRQWLHTGALIVLAPYLAKFGIHLPG